MITEYGRSPGVRFLERLSKKGTDRLVFNEIRDQIIVKRIRIKKSNMQDAFFKEADKGEYGKPGGNDGKTGRSKDQS